MSLEQRVRGHFAGEALEYDDLIVRLIPGYEEQNEIILRSLKEFKQHASKALDLGAGTGILSCLILKSYPKTSVIAFDMVENMLRVCEAKLSAFKDRLALRQGNFATDDFGANYDIVVSGLAIHHLQDDGKRGLYSSVYDSLNPGGIFINRDVVLGKTMAETNEYHKKWRDFMRSNGEDDAFWFKRHLEEDKPATLEDQLSWLVEAGFQDVCCYSQHINVAVFGGKK